MAHKDRELALSHERLRVVVDYDPATGIFRWKRRTSNRVAVGDICGQIDRHGHRMISVDGWRYMAHRLAWFYVHGRWPVDEIDHKNLSKNDNRIENLREATHAENVRNVTKKKHNKSGYKGVIRHTQSPHKFVAQITVNGRTKYLGMFDNPREAHAAYVAASQIHHLQYGRDF